MDKDLLEDAIQLCDKAIRTMDDCENFKKGLREISIEAVKEHEYQIDWDDAVLSYKYTATPSKLQKDGVLSETFIPAINSQYRKRSKGYLQVYIDYQKAKEWMDGAINQLLSKQKHHVIIPEGRDHVYENGIFAIILKNNTQDVIDLSKSPRVKPVFDVFYRLYTQSPQASFTQQELLQEYASITNDEISWVEFTKKVGDIKKRINAKMAFKKRIAWEYNRKKQTYDFKILPLTSSD